MAAIPTERRKTRQGLTLRTATVVVSELARVFRPLATSVICTCGLTLQALPATSFHSRRSLHKRFATILHTMADMAFHAWVASCPPQQAFPAAAMTATRSPPPMQRSVETKGRIGREDSRLTALRRKHPGHCANSPDAKAKARAQLS